MLTHTERQRVILAVQCEFGLTVKMISYRMPWFSDPGKQRAVERTARFYRRFYRRRGELAQCSMERRVRRTRNWTASTSGDAARS